MKPIKAGATNKRPQNASLSNNLRRILTSRRGKVTDGAAIGILLAMIWGIRSLLTSASA